MRSSNNLENKTTSDSDTHWRVQLVGKKVQAHSFLVFGKKFLMSFFRVETTYISVFQAMLKFESSLAKFNCCEKLVLSSLGYA